MEVVDPDIVEDSEYEVHQESTDGKSNQLLNKHTSRFVKLDIFAMQMQEKEREMYRDSRCK